MQFTPQASAWDAIADAWDKVRRKPNPLAEQLAAQWTPGKILDIGCGNGRNLLPFAQRGFACVGIDTSKKLRDYATERLREYPAVLVHGNATELPFPDESFDGVIFLAVLHHLSPQYQKQALAELFRVLKPGGKAAISVWNKLQWGFVFGSKERFIPWTLDNGQRVDRYYYFFTFGELKKLLRAQGFVIESVRGRFGKNCDFIVRKPA